LKILLLTTHLNVGGIASYLKTLAYGLIKSGHQVVVVSSGGELKSDFEKMGAKVLNFNIRTKSEIDPKIYFALKKLKEEIIKEKIDIIHAHTRVTQVMGHFLKSSALLGYVSTCHGFFKPKLFRQLFPCWGDRVIAISHPVYEHLKNDFKVPQEKIALIENGIDAKAFKVLTRLEKIAHRAQYGFGDEPVLGIIARLSDVKGQDLLILAMKKVLGVLPKTKLMIVGQGPMEEKLKGMVCEHHLENSVRFFPVINQTSEMLSCFDVCVNPSRQEGLGLSVMEAQVSGLAVVATRVGGIVSLIKNRETGILVEPENSNALAQSLIELLQDIPLQEKLGIQARKFIEANYSADKMVQKTISVYQGLLRHE
jgi:glycosyltransferase involved in cell wall biosynthesis